MLIRVTRNDSGRVVLLHIDDIRRVEDYTSPSPDRTAKSVVHFLSHKEREYTEGLESQFLVKEKEILRLYVNETVDDIFDQTEYK